MTRFLARLVLGSWLLIIVMGATAALAIHAYDAWTRPAFVW